jgi:hypothetical protein
MTFWQKLKPFLGLAALFVVGMLCGALLLGGFLKRKAQEGDLPAFLSTGTPNEPVKDVTKNPDRQFRSTPVLGDPNRWTKTLLNRLDTKLELTAEQKAKIEPGLFKSASQIQAIQIQTRDQVQKILADNRGQIIQFLNPEQVDKFQKMQEEQSRRRAGLPGAGGASELPGPEDGSHRHLKDQAPVHPKP